MDLCFSKRVFDTIFIKGPLTQSNELEVLQYGEFLELEMRRSNAKTFEK